VVFLIILARVTKRAQIPFSAWLPAAIAAPTPVRALVHSSTLVTAGVYLLIRFREPIYKRGAVRLVVWISVITILIAGLGALFEGDIKKVIALSTLRQLGLIIIILIGGIKELAFFHLITHAIFKSSLFICAGFMIHKAGGSQDSRVIRGFRVRRPTLGVLLSGTNLALCGFPFMAGFYSKDVSLEYIVGNRENRLLTIMIILGTGLTVAYRLRVIYLSRLRLRTRKVLRDQSDFSTKVLKRVRILFLGTIFRGFLIY
jgi:NADH-ubiquinone oxidoreductase chain 5